VSQKKSLTREPQVGSLELTEELIRQRAYGYYEERGRENGYDLEDWLRAESEIMGRHVSSSESVPEAAKSASAA